MQNMERHTTILRSCGCISPYQDRTYGTRQRVHNIVSGTGTREGDARCTVCSTVHGPPPAQVKAKVTETKVTGIARMGGKKAGKKGKKGKKSN